MIDEKDILLRISEGEEAAFHVIFVEYYPKIKNFLLKIIHDADITQDIAQDVFVKIWMMRSILPEVNSLNSYLYRMSKNAAINYLKSISKQTSLTGIDIEDGNVIEDVLSSKEKLSALNDVIREMPEKRRKVFVLSRFYNKPNAEIAEEMNITKKTVENHINLAMKDINKDLLGLISFFSFFVGG